MSFLHVIMHTTSFQVCPPQSYTEKLTENRKAQKCLVQLSHDLNLRTLGQVFTTGGFLPALFPL